MKNKILILLVSLVAFSCSKNEVKKEVKSEVAQVAPARIEFSNPSFFAGSTFGEFFVSMIRTQNYDMALKFTSKGSKEKVGSKNLVDKFGSYDLNYKLSLKSVKQSGDTFNLAYATNEFATGKLKKMTVVLENDTCKLVLQNNSDELIR